MWLNYLDHEANDRARRKEFATFRSFAASELAEKVFVNLSEQVAGKVRRNVGEVLEQLVWNSVGLLVAREAKIFVNAGSVKGDPAMSSPPFPYLRAAGLLRTVLGRIRKLFRFAVLPKERPCFCRRLVRPLHLPSPRRELRNGSPWIVFYFEQIGPFET